MTFFTDYFEAIDVVAIIACVALVIAAFVRDENIWLGILAVVVVLWAVTRLLHIV
jgi:hypothetical protein